MQRRENIDKTVSSVTVRDIVAMDLALHGKTFILVEFTGCTMLFLCISVIEFYVAIATAKTPLLQLASGIFFLWMAINCLTMLLLACRIIALKQILPVSTYTREQVKKATITIAVYILLPLVLPIMAIRQVLQSADEEKRGAS